MTSKKSSEIFVSGASGWLGKELISLINQKRLIENPSLIEQDPSSPSITLLFPDRK